jgi:hypothetical protein
VPLPSETTRGPSISNRNWHHARRRSTVVSANRRCRDLVRAAAVCRAPTRRPEYGRNEPALPVPKHRRRGHPRGLAAGRVAASVERSRPNPSVLRPKPRNSRDRAVGRRPLPLMSGLSDSSGRYGIGSGKSGFKALLPSRDRTRRTSVRRVDWPRLSWASVSPGISPPKPWGRLHAPSPRELPADPSRRMDRRCSTGCCGFRDWLASIAGGCRPS